ncbi:hypothetical protein PI126_g15669 [Phytophthora idaei]|nr:hypothetical protein PI126_g15669 [Phytophthora idaei]
MEALLERSPAVRRSLIVARLPRWRDLIRRRSIWILRHGSLHLGIPFRHDQIDPAQIAVGITFAKARLAVAVRLDRCHGRLHFGHCSRRSESKVAAPGSACQVGNRGPQTVAQTLTEEEDAERASCVGNSVPHGAVSAPDVAIETSHDVGNEVPRRGRRRRHRRRRKSNLNNIQTGVAPSDSESRARAPLTRPVEECYHVFDGMTGRPVKAAGIHLEPLPEVSELLNPEEMAVDDFLADLKAG